MKILFADYIDDESTRVTDHILLFDRDYQYMIEKVSDGKIDELLSE